MHDCDTSWLESVFARGDRSLAPVLERAYRAGARFDSWEDQKKMSVWEDAFRDEGVEPAKYLGTIPATARLPWDHIDVGLEEGFLLREYRKALKNRLSLPCGKVAGAFVHATNLVDAQADARKLVCYDCGVACDLSAMREQRLVFLRKLGADEPRAPSPPREDRPKGPRPPPRTAQGDARRYRFVYEKRGPAAFLSHLDVVRALPRAFRRLELPLYYSQGFHPKPDMIFTPALSLGVASLCEVVDIKIAADLDPSELLGPPHRGRPVPGLRFVGGAPASGSTTPGSLASSTSRATPSGFRELSSTLAGVMPGSVSGSRRRSARRSFSSCAASTGIEQTRRRPRFFEGDRRRFGGRIRVARRRGDRGRPRRALGRGRRTRLGWREDFRGRVEAVFGDSELPHRSVRRPARKAHLPGRAIASPVRWILPAASEAAGRPESSLRSMPHRRRPEMPSLSGLLRPGALRRAVRAARRRADGRPGTPRRPCTGRRCRRGEATPRSRSRRPSAPGPLGRARPDRARSAERGSEVGLAVGRVHGGERKADRR